MSLTLSAETGPDLQSRAAGAHRFAVIDIGSNTVRLVVFGGLTRTPVQIFNEKAVCGLGRGMAQTGSLDREGTALALDTLARFRSLLDAMGVADVAAIATSAVRDASDGKAFLASVEDRARLKPRVISGKEEARLSALGVRSGVPDAAGVMGDMGGGSLELVNLSESGGIGPQISLPIGPLRFLGGGLKGRQIDSHIDRELARVPWLTGAEPRPLYVVGGAWRAIAKAHMAHTEHPIHIIHHYEVPTAKGLEFARLLSKQSRDSLERMPGVSGRRLDAIPLAARILGRLLEAMRPSTMIFSAYGLREGLIFDRLDPADKRRDPLIDYCKLEARRTGRFGDAAVLDQWIAGLFPDASEKDKRLRLAACLLSDIAWAHHPDYRCEHATLQVLRMPSAGLSHGDRAFLAQAIRARYGNKGDSHALPLKRLLSETEVARANAIGAALRLAYTITGGALSLLETANLNRRNGTLTLSLPGLDHLLLGDVINRRIGALSRALDAKEWKIVTT